MVAIGWRARWPLPANILAAALFMLAGAALGAAAAHRHHHELRPVSAGLADPAAGAAKALASFRAVLRRCRGNACARPQPGGAAALLCAGGGGDRRDRHGGKPLRYLRERCRFSPSWRSRRGAAGRAAAVDPAVRGTFQSSGRAAGRSPERFAPSGQSGDPCGRQHLRHARQLFRTEGGLAARGRPHRQLVQLSVRRLAAADPAAVVRRRRRRRVAAAAGG